MLKKEKKINEKKRLNQYLIRKANLLKELEDECQETSHQAKELESFVMRKEFIEIIIGDVKAGRV